MAFFHFFSSGGFNELTTYSGHYRRIRHLHYSPFPKGISFRIQKNPYFCRKFQLVHYAH